MSVVQAKSLQIDKKYYILWCNWWYEAKLKKIGSIYGNIQFVFKTKLGDLYLSYDDTKTMWNWQQPKIYEDRFEAILELGLQLFKGKHYSRKPYSQSKHISITMKHIPEKMV